MSFLRRILSISHFMLDPSLLESEKTNSGDDKMKHDESQTNEQPKVKFYFFEEPSNIHLILGFLILLIHNLFHFYSVQRAKTKKMKR